MTLTYRLVKGSELTHSELDGNFSDLDAKALAAASAISANTSAITDLDARLDAVEPLASAALPATGLSSAIDALGVVKATTNPLTGGIKHIVDPVNGGGAFNFSGDRNLSSANIEFLPTSILTNWTTDKSAALTVEVDNTVTFNGNPSIKVTIPPGTSGNLQVGTAIANALIPYGWDKSDFSVAVKYVGFTGYDWVSTFPPTLTTYLGDASMTNFFTVNRGPEHYPELKPQEGEWFIVKPSITNFATGGGAPAIATTMRAKLRWTQVSQGTPSYIYIGLLGKMPRRKKATVVLTLDDGYASWYSFVRPVLKHYNIPASMGIQKIYANQPGFMTEAQILDLYNDQSCLFDIVNHAKRNVSYATLGADGYYAELNENRNYLRSIGIGGDGPNHHPYVQTLWGNDLVSLMRAGGFLSARSGVSATEYSHGRDGALAAGEDKMQYSIRSRIGLTTGTTLANATALIDTAIANKELCFIMGHDFADSAATDVWAYSDFVQLIGYLASKVDAGQLEVKSWTRWFADLKGMTTDRR